MNNLVSVWQPPTKQESLLVRVGVPWIYPREMSILPVCCPILSKYNNKANDAVNEDSKCYQVHGMLFLSMRTTGLSEVISSDVSEFNQLSCMNASRVLCIPGTFLTGFISSVSRVNWFCLHKGQYSQEPSGLGSVSVHNGDKCKGHTGIMNCTGCTFLMPAVWPNLYAAHSCCSNDSVSSIAFSRVVSIIVFLFQPFRKTYGAHGALLR